MVEAEPTYTHRSPPEGPLDRGCWWTGAFLVALFAMPVAIPWVWWRSGESGRQEALRSAREQGDKYCMGAWAVVHAHRERHGFFPEALDGLPGLPEKPAILRHVAGAPFGYGRHFRLEYTIDDPRSLFGSATIRRSWSSRTGRWTETVE